MVKELSVLVLPRFLWIISQISYRETILDVGAQDGFVWKQGSYDVVKLDKVLKDRPDVQAEAEHLPFSANSFDIVCLCEILEHVDDPHIVLREAVRVAKLKVVITVPWEEQWAKEANPFTGIHHIRYYTPPLFEAELTRIGLPFQIIPLAWGGFKGSENFPRNVWLGAEIYGCEVING